MSSKRYKIIAFKAALMLFFLLCGGLSTSRAQDAKIEKEERIKAKEVPGNAKSWLRDAYEGRKKVRWYRETNESGYSIEAKFSWEGSFHSIEFDELGMIIDIEIERDIDELSSAAREGLKSYFESLDKFRLLKIQQQYSGKPDDLEDFIDEDEQDAIAIRFEVEFYASRDGDYRLWEGLFDATGQLISIRRIIQRPTDNLDY